ncbi:unnamed protein product, partial [Aphanomyces euteiches]
MDAGVIPAFKQAYKTCQMETALKRFGNGQDVLKCFKLDVLEAMEISLKLWTNIGVDAISNSWKHTGILADESDHDWN